MRRSWLSKKKTYSADTEKGEMLSKQKLEENASTPVHIQQFIPFDC